MFGGRPLFDEATLRRRTREWKDSPIAGLSEKSGPISAFNTDLVRIFNQSSKKGRKFKEPELEQSFNQSFFAKLLGYVFYPTEGWTAWPKPQSADTGLSGEPDLLLGQHGPDGVFRTIAVVELKKPGTPLDGPQASYKGRSPVEQAFEYARDLPTCQWVIVTDMVVVRLYSVTTQGEYHELSFSGGDNAYATEQAYRLLALPNLIEGGDDSPTNRLLLSSREGQLFVRDAFYKIYADIRSDLLEAVTEWARSSYSRSEIVLGVQRLLDRLLFIFFCEHHPDRLLPAGLVKGLTERAIQLPGSSLCKVYDQLKALFHDLDVGASTRSWVIPKYNGELFKPDKLLDDLQLPDSLQEKFYAWESPKGGRKAVRGVYGLHEFDFWRELDRDLLGNLFERSIGDLEKLSEGHQPGARSAFGVFYTASRLAQFVADSAVSAMLDEDEHITAALEQIATVPGGAKDEIVNLVVSELKKFRIADFACGSGVFLTAALDCLACSLQEGAGGRFCRRTDKADIFVSAV